MKIKKDPRPLYQRLWVFQKERAPLYGVILMAGSTVGVAYKFSDQSWRHYIVAVLIIALYLIQIRTADERKDFEHDNKYHPTRPVQRGVVTLRELAVLNKASIIGQLVLYASFLDLRIFLLGVLSQGYAQLTSKEFFVREWIRQHFYIYYVTHYFQLAILFYAMVTIIKPQDVPYWAFIVLYMLCVILTELGRKMLSVEDDTTDDTYSAQLGHRGSAVTLTVFGLLITGMVYYFIDRFSQNYIFLIAPIIVLMFIGLAAYHYAIAPDRNHADKVEQASGLMYIVAMLTIIIGA